MNASQYTASPTAHNKHSGSLWIQHRNWIYLSSEKKRDTVFSGLYIRSNNSTNKPLVHYYRQKNLIILISRGIINRKTPLRKATAAGPHLHGEAGSPLGPPPAVSLAAAAVPAALLSLFSSQGSHSCSPVFPSTAPSVESAEKSAAALSQAQPGRQPRRREKTRQKKAGHLIYQWFNKYYWKFCLKKGVQSFSRT